MKQTDQHEPTLAELNKLYDETVKSSGTPRFALVHCKECKLDFIISYGQEARVCVHLKKRMEEFAKNAKPTS